LQLASIQTSALAGLRQLWVRQRGWTRSPRKIDLDAGMPRAATVSVRVLLLGLLALLAIKQLSGAHGSTLDDLSARVVAPLITVLCSVAMIVVGLRDRRRSLGFLVLGIGQLLWASGDVLWDYVYALQAHPPLISLTDALHFSQVIFAPAGLVLLIHQRIEDFEVSRWLDGLLNGLAVAIPLGSVTLGPILERANSGDLSTIVQLGYPFMDVVNLGIVIGVIAMTGWRPGPPWGLLAAACATWAIQDILNVQSLVSSDALSGHFDWLGQAGQIMFAWAALRPVVKTKVTRADAWHQLILPLGLQLIVLATVAYDYFSPLPDATKIMMMLILSLAAIQILLVSRDTTRRTQNERSNSATAGVAAGTPIADEDGQRDLREQPSSSRQRSSRRVEGVGLRTFRGMRLSGTVSPDRPLLVMAVNEEAQFYDGDLPLLLTGMGKVNAAVALASVLARGPHPSGVINLGTAGALRPGWSGTHVVGTVIQHDLDDGDALRQQTGESSGQPFVLADRNGPTLATSDVCISDPLVRKRLSERAALVDMEAYALAAAANQAGVPIRVVKHVSNSASEAAAESWRTTMAGSAHALAEWIESNVAAYAGPISCPGSTTHPATQSIDKQPRSRNSRS
jgi:adenosylhomocysteine nucleosidase